MRLIAKTATFALALFATVAIAADATDPVAKARQELMGTIGMNMKTLGDMAGAKSAFDAAAAEAAKAALIAAAADIPAKFEIAATDPASTAKPEIWTDFEGFKKDASEMSAAATALDVASLETLQAGMGAIGGTCKDCHTAYRSK